MKRVRERVLESGRQVEARALFAWKGVVGVERLHGHTGRWLLERLIVRTARRVLEGWRQWTWAQVRLGHAGLMVMRMRMRRQARRTLVGWAGARKSKGGDKDSEKVEEVSAVCFPMTRSVTPPLTVRIRRSGGVGKGL